MRALLDTILGPRYPANAAEWLARRQTHALTDEELGAFNAWLISDPAHSRDYSRCESLSRMAGKMRARPDLVQALPAYAALDAPRRAHLSAWTLAAAATVAAVALGLAWHFPAGSPDPSSSATYRTAHGEVREIVLPDGSRVHLNTDSNLRVAFSADERRVVLSHGEAYFEVVKEPGGRAFVVDSRATRVRVVGTKFSVRTLDKGTDVIVSEGKVEVVPDASMASPALPAKIELVPGNVLKFDPVEHQVLIAAVDPERATAWRSGTIDFDNATLEEMVAEVNRYTRVPFVIGDARLRALRVSGTFRVGDAESVRFALRDALNIEAVTQGDRVELRALQ